MKKLLAILSLAALPFTTLAVFPTNNTTATFTTTSISDYADYDWTWSALDDQYMDLTFDVDVSDGTLAFRLNKTKTGDTQLEVAGFTVTGTNGVVGFSGTNLPPNRTYYSEIMLYDSTSTPNRYRSLAKGKVKIINSLWQGTNTQASGVTVVAPIYPLAISWTDSTSTNQDMLVHNGTSWAKLAVGSSGEVLTVSGSTNVEWAASAGGGSGDLTEVQVSGGLLSVTSGTGPVPIVGLTTAAVQSAQSAETDPIWAATDLAANNASSLTNLNGTSIASGTVADARIASTLARDSEVTSAISGAGHLDTSGWGNRSIFATDGLGEIAEIAFGAAGYVLSANGSGSAPAWTDLATLETDPIWAAVSNTVTVNAANGNTAYGWGDHATNGYLTTALTNNAGTAVTLATTNEASTSDTEAMTAGAVSRAVAAGGGGSPIDSRAATNTVDFGGNDATNAAVYGFDNGWYIDTDGTGFVFNVDGTNILLRVN